MQKEILQKAWIAQCLQHIDLITKLIDEKILVVAILVVRGRLMLTVSSKFLDSTTSRNTIIYRSN